MNISNLDSGEKHGRRWMAASWSLRVERGRLYLMQDRHSAVRPEFEISFKKGLKFARMVGVEEEVVAELRLQAEAIAAESATRRERANDTYRREMEGVGQTDTEAAKLLATLDVVIGGGSVA